MSEKRLSFIIDPSKAKTGADKLRGYLEGITKEADKLQKSLNFDIKLSSTGAKDLSDIIKNTNKTSEASKEATSSFAKFEKQLEDIRKRIEFYNTEAGKQLILERQKAAEIVKATKAQADANAQMTAAERAAKNLAQSLEFWKQRQLDLNSTKYKELVALRESSRQIEAYRKSLVNALTPAQQLAKAEKLLEREMQQTAAQLAMYKKGLTQKSIAQKEALSIQRQLAQSEERLKQSYTEQYATILKNNEALKRRRREILGLDDANDRATRSTSKLTAGMGALAGAFGALTGGFVIAELVRVADTYTAIQNRLAVVTDGTLDLANATREMLSVSMNARTDLSSTMDVYAKLTRVTKGTAIQQEDLLGITETLSKAVAMSGASAQGAQGALLQFSQALAGNFQASAQELNSIIEQTPAVAQTMADALNSVNPQLNASIGNLKRLATEGKFTTEELLQGFINIKDMVDQQFNNSMRTVTQSVQAVKDAFTVALGEVDKATGASEFLSGILIGLAESLDGLKATLAGAAVGLATFVGVVGAGGIVQLLMMLGPLGLAIAGAATALGLIAGSLTKSAIEMELLRDETDKLTEANKKLEKSLPDLRSGYEKLSLEDRAEEFTKILEDISEAAEDLEKAQKAFSDSGTGSTMDIQAMLLRNEQVGKLNDQYELQKEKLGELQKATAQVFDGSVVENFSKAFNSIIGTNTKVVKTVKDVVKALSDESTIQETIIRQQAEARVLQDAYVKAKELGVEVTTDFIKALLEEESLFDNARDRIQEFKSLKDQLDPVNAAINEYSESMKLLNENVKQGTPLWENLATAIGNKFNEVIQEARRNTIGTLEYLQAKVQETTEYLASRIQGGQDTGAIDMDKILSVLDKPRGKTSNSFEKMAQNFLDKLDKGILGPQGAAEMLGVLRNHADKLGALGEGFDVAGMRAAVMNLTAIAKEKFGTADLQDLTIEELAQVFREEQEKARRAEELDQQLRSENNQNLKMLGEWAKAQLGLQGDGELTPEEQKEQVEKIQKEEAAWREWQKTTLTQDNENLRTIAEWATKEGEKADRSPKGSITIKVVKEKGGTVEGVVSGEVDFLNQLANTLSRVSTSVG